MKKVVSVISIITFLTFAFADDWLTKVWNEERHRLEIDLTYDKLTLNHLDETYWVIANPFEGINGEEDERPITRSKGYIFLPDKKVLCVENMWSSQNLNKINPAIENAVWLNITRINYFDSYSIDSEGYICFTNHDEKIFLRNNRLYVIENGAESEYFLHEVFFYSSENDLWNGYIY